MIYQNASHHYKYPINLIVQSVSFSECKGTKKIVLIKKHSKKTLPLFFTTIKNL